MKADIYKGKYYKAKDATKDIDIVTIEAECRNLDKIAEDLNEMDTKASELFDMCNGDNLRVYQNTMEDSIETYSNKIIGTAEETFRLSNEILETATQIYLQKQDAYNKEAYDNEVKKLKKEQVLKEKKEKAKAKKESKKKGGKATSVLVGSITNRVAPDFESVQTFEEGLSLGKSLNTISTPVGRSVTRSSTKATKYSSSGLHTSDEVIFNESKINDAQTAIERINGELADLDDRLYATLRKLATAQGFELVEDKNSNVDLHLPEKLMMENRNDARNIGNTLTNLVSLFNIINTGETASTSAPTTAAQPTTQPTTQSQHWTVTNAPTTAAPTPQTVPATVAPQQQATTPGTVAPPTASNVQAREADKANMSSLTGTSGTISGTSTSAPTSTVLPASPISFDSAIPDGASSKSIGAYAIPAAAGIVAGIGGLGIAHTIKRDKEDEELFGDTALDKEFAEEFNNQVKEIQKHNEETQEPIRDEKDIYKFFK